MDLENRCLGCMEDIGSVKSCPHCGYNKDFGPISPHHLKPGTLLNEKYLVGKVLGQGGFGITYLAWDLNLDIKLAIKEYFPQGLVLRTPGASTVDTFSGDMKNQYVFGLDRFLSEAKTLARFSEHPNIVKVRDYFESNGTAYMVMNYVIGVTLEEYLLQKGGKIHSSQALKIMMPILDALNEVHKTGILHRDVSPDNIIIEKSGRVILIDFGSARQELQQKSRSLSVIVKVGYSPEEQYRSKGEQGPWTDIYAVAATIYRAITGEVPPQSMDRLAGDDLVKPSHLSNINHPLEQALLKALAVRSKDRYQNVKEFQGVLLENDMVLKKLQMEETKVIAKDDIKQEPKKLRIPSAVAPTEKQAKDDSTFIIRKKMIISLAVVGVCSFLIYGTISLLGGGLEFGIKPRSDKASMAALNGQTGSESEVVQIDPAVIAALDADYYIDYENGTITLGDLPIGARVVDPSWKWEFRTGNNYSGIGAVKPVTWIVVAEDHYDGLQPHVTLLAEEMIAKYPFDNSTNRAHRYAEYGYNHWGDSGTANATRGLRPWLNSTGSHAGEGFYRAFSESFKQGVLTTNLPNREWKSGSAYSTQDRVILPSTTELGDGEHDYTYRIGDVYAYFQGADNYRRVARIGGETRWYWTRSPDSSYGNRVRLVIYAGEFGNSYAYYVSYGVRPALNLKAETLVTKIRDSESNPEEKTVVFDGSLVEQNQQGNTVGNISNDGYAAQQGEWIYYRSNDGGSIYKIKLDGSGREKINDEDADNLNVLGEWIYYRNLNDGGKIYRIRLDGRGREKINNYYSGGIIVTGDWIYYSNWSDDGKIYKIRTDGSGSEKINDSTSWSLNIIDDWIYHINDGDDRKIYKVRIDGSEFEVVYNYRTDRICIVDDWIYLSTGPSSGHKIYKIRIDGSGLERVNEDSSSWVNVASEWIYYVNSLEGSNIYKVRTDGSAREKINDNVSMALSVVGEWIYYHDNNYYIYKVRTDGSGQQRVD